jgi:hypothetical protein
LVGHPETIPIGRVAGLWFNWQDAALAHHASQERTSGEKEKAPNVEAGGCFGIVFDG